MTPTFGLLFILLLGADTISWERDYDSARELAQTEGKILFIAVNMDGERANDTLAKKTYKDERIVELTKKTINLIGSTAEHRGGNKVCPRFGSLSCVEHREVDRSLRDHVLEPTLDGYVISPQHVFLGPDGKVLLSVPYALTQSELEWCFHQAFSRLDPEYTFPEDFEGRPPKRLRMLDVQAATEKRESPKEPTGRIYTKKELSEMLRDAKKAPGKERREIFLKVITADEPEAHAFVRGELKNKEMGRGQQRLRRVSLHNIGRFSPESYWKVLAEYAKSSHDLVRSEVAVAFEALGAPESLKVVKSAYNKEKVVEVRKNWIRALGSVGGLESSIRKLLMEVVQGDDEDILRVNAIIALGSVAIDKDVDATLRAELESPDIPHRIAAACAMGITRRDVYVEALTQAIGREPNQTVKEIMSRAAKVLRGANLRLIRKDVRAVAQETIQRERFFGD